MRDDLLQSNLESQLGRLDWRFGIKKTALVQHLAANPPAQQALSRGLIDGLYFSPADVLTSLSPGAWREPPPASPTPGAPGTSGSPGGPETSNSVAGIGGTAEPLTHISPQVAAGVVGGAALVGVAAGVGWLLRRQHGSPTSWRP